MNVSEITRRDIVCEIEDIDGSGFVFSQAIIGAARVAMVPVRRSMMWMQLVKRMINVIKEVGIHVNAIRNLSTAFAVKSIRTHNKEGMPEYCTIICVYKNGSRADFSVSLCRV